jgi:hypothetical protein
MNDEPRRRRRRPSRVCVLTAMVIERRSACFTEIENLSTINRFICFISLFSLRDFFFQRFFFVQR